MKKRFSLILALLMILAMLSACTKANESSQGQNSGGGSEAESKQSSETPAGEEGNDKSGETVKLVIWHEADGTIADTLQNRLNNIDGVEVSLERKEQMSDALKLVGNDPKSAPDMYFWAHDKVGLFAAMGILAPVTDIIGDDVLSALLPMTVDAGIYKEEKYQLPVYFETLLFMYNKALMEAPPETTDALLGLMKEKTTDDMYVFVEQHSTAYNAAAWIHGYDGFIINADSQPGLDNQGTIDALGYHKDFIPYMPADGEYNTVTTLFSEGKAWATTGGPWLVPGLKDAGIDLGIAPMPKLPNGAPLTPFSGVQGVSVLKHAAAEKKEAVAEVLKALASPETGIALAKSANCAPANAASYNDGEVSGNEMIIAMRETADNVVPMPNVPEMDVMWGVTDSMLAAINKNNGDVKTECETAQKQALEQIAAMQ